MANRKAQRKDQPLKPVCLVAENAGSNPVLGETVALVEKTA